VRVLPFEVDDAASLLARGTALLDALADDPILTLRWYRASTPAVVLGRGQPVPEQVSELPVVVRFSGGGAVLMDAGLLSLDVLVPTGHPLLAGRMTDVFTRVGVAWGSALTDLGVPRVTVHDGPSSARRRGSTRERLLAAVCYATVSQGEVLAGGRKLVGLAQRRRRAGALVQCGLLRTWDPRPVLHALGASPDDADMLGRAVGLDDLVNDPPSDESIMAAVGAHLRGYRPFDG
jgi:lipoate---protein ligase